MAVKFIWANGMAKSEEHDIFYAISCVLITAKNSSVCGDGVRICQYVQMLTAAMNVNQEKGL
ncbi:hypothetical protein [Nostoc sp.]